MDNKYIVDALKAIESAMHIVNTLTVKSTAERNRWYRLQANILHENGNILIFQSQTKTDTAQAIELWEKAMTFYGKIDDEDSINEIKRKVHNEEQRKTTIIKVHANDVSSTEYGNMYSLFVKSIRSGEGNERGGDNGVTGERKGKVTKEDVLQFTKALQTFPDLRPNELEELMAQIGTDAKGNISFDELWRWWSAVPNFNDTLN